MNTENEVHLVHFIFLWIVMKVKKDILFVVL